MPTDPYAPRPTAYGRGGTDKRPMAPVSPFAGPRPFEGAEGRGTPTGYIGPTGQGAAGQGGAVGQTGPGGYGAGGGGVGVPTGYVGPASQGGASYGGQPQYMGQSQMPTQNFHGSVGPGPGPVGGAAYPPNSRPKSFSSSLQPVPPSRPADGSVRF